MTTTKRPSQAKLLSALLLSSSVFMALLGMSASAYYVPAACLLLQAILLWRGAAFKLFKWIIELNQLSGLILILVLWLGDALHLPKLDISGAMLLLNLLLGGPLMSILAIPLIGSLHLSSALPHWFGLPKAAGKSYPLPQWEQK